MSSSSRRQCLRSQTRETIAKVYEFLKKDATDILQLVNEVHSSGPVLISKLSDHLNCVRKRTATAVGVSERTVTNILAEGKQTGSRFKSPHRDRKKPSKKTTTLEPNNTHTIKQINNFEDVNKNICILCFANNVRVFSIEDTELQNILECLSSEKMPSKSHPLCYICYKRLLQCEQLVKQMQELKTEYNQSQEKPLVHLSIENNYIEVPRDLHKFYVPIIKEGHEKEECK